MGEGARRQVPRGLGCHGREGGRNVIMGTLVYRYGLLAPTVGAEKVREILSTAHRYSNDLVAVERGRRAALRDIESRLGLARLLDEHATADEWCAFGARAVADHKSRERTAKVPAELRDRLVEVKRWRSVASVAIREAKRGMREEYGAEYDEVNALAAGLRRDARGVSGLASAGPHYGAHGTYQVVEEAAEKARGDRPLYDPMRGWGPNDPRFRRATAMDVADDGRVTRLSDGTLGVQIQGGMTVGELASHAQLQIVPRVRGCTRPDSRRGRTGRTLRMRVGSTARSGREAVYAEWPMVMHRELPADAQIMNARVHVRRGDPDEWYVTLTVRTGADRAPAERAGSVAINVGWRRVPDGVRVASWVGEDGGRGEVVCGPSVLDRLSHASSIRSIRDEMLDLARPWGAEVLASIALPEWLARDTVTLRAWKSTGRLRDVVRVWARRRFAGDSDAFAAFDAWARRDRHLHQYEQGERSGAEAHRREVYRVAASRLAGRYTTLVHDGVDLASLKTCPMVEAERGNPAARSNMHASAPGELRDAMVNAFRGDVAKVSGVDVTHTCPACGVVESFDAAIKVSHRCGACGDVWDQDFAAAENLLGRHIRERGNGAQDAGTARNDKPAELQESARMRSKRMARERAERVTARNAGDKAAE